MKIWIDLDGVISAFTPNVIRVANELWPNKLPLDYVPQDWNYTEVLSKDEWDKIWEVAKTIPDFWLRQTPILANLFALRMWLKTTKHQVFYITSRMNTGGTSAYQQSAQWLIRHSLYPPTAQLRVTKNPGEKKKIVEEYNIEMGIDDLPSTVQDMNMLSWHHCYLLSQPCNALSNQARCQNLQEFLDIVDSASESHQET